MFDWKLAKNVAAFNGLKRKNVSIAHYLVG